MFAESALFGKVSVLVGVVVGPGTTLLPRHCRVGNSGVLAGGAQVSGFGFLGGPAHHRQCISGPGFGSAALGPVPG